MRYIYSIILTYMLAIDMYIMPVIIQSIRYTNIAYTYIFNLGVEFTSTGGTSKAFTNTIRYTALYEFPNIPDINKSTKSYTPLPPTTLLINIRIYHMYTKKTLTQMRRCLNQTPSCARVHHITSRSCPSVGCSPLPTPVAFYRLLLRELGMQFPRLSVQRVPVVSKYVYVVQSRCQESLGLCYFAG